MDNQEDQNDRNAEREHRAEIAGRKVSEMGLPKRIEVPTETSVLGEKFLKVYAQTRENLLKEFGAELTKIMAVALHEYWLACWDGATFFQVNIDDKSFLDNNYTRNMATPEGYADAHGWAHTLADGFSDITPSEARKRWIKKLTGHEILDVHAALQCMAIQWLNQASAAILEKNVEQGLDLLCEANIALSTHSSYSTWDDAWKEATYYAEIDVRSKIRSEIAKKAALAAHAESHALKAEVKEFWGKNISPTISNDAAATILIRNFPLQFRTLSKYISEWKKLQSASRV